MIRHLTLWGALLLLFIQPIFTQQVVAPTASLSGSVLDGENKEPLIGATVSIKPLKIGAVTNKSGFFTLKNIPSGKHPVTISFLGFAKKEILMEFAAGEAKRFTAELKKQIS